jgi:MFS family permease
MEFGAIIAGIAPIYSIYAVARLLIGIGTGGLGLISYVWSAELVGTQGRSMLIIFQGCGFALGILLLSPLAYMIPHWRWLLFILFLCGIPNLLFQRWVVESPKWLAGSVGRLDDAHSMLVRIAEVNGRPGPPPPPLPRAKGSNTFGGTENNKESGHGVLRLLICDSRLSWRFTTMCLAWFALSFGYYGVSMNASNIGSSVYVSSAVLSLVEMPTFPLALWLVKAGRAGRRVGDTSLRHCKSQ